MIQVYENAYPQRPELIETLMAEKSFTLIGGGSTGGKTTLIFQGLEEWIVRSTFLGYKCFRLPHFHYYAFDRVIETVYDKLNDMKINFGEWVTIKSFALDDFTKSSFLFPQVAQGDVVILDGLDMLVNGGKIKEFGDVNSICRDCKKLVDVLGISVVGMIGAVKSHSNGDSNGSPIDKLLGSGVWQRISETNMLIEHVNARDIEDPQRYLYIRPRLGKGRHMTLEFRDDARLHFVTKGLNDHHEFLTCIPVGVHKKKALLDIANRNNVKNRTADRWIADLCKEKKLEQVTFGTYRKNPPRLN